MFIRFPQSIIFSLALAIPLTLSAACGDDQLSNKELVTTVLEQGLAGGDTDVINDLVREDYIQHSALVADGRAGLLQAVDAFAGTSVEIHRILEDGDMVVTHSTYTFPDGSQQVAFDVFRVQDGLLAEHWDALQTPVPASEAASGRSMVDGPTEIVDRDQTEANRALVQAHLDKVLIGGDLASITDFISSTQYDQHNPAVADGLDAFTTFATELANNGIAFGYTENHLLVAEGNFVFIASEGFFGPADVKPFVLFYDLFRIEDGKIVEHWDVIPNPVPNPDNLPHDNGLF